MSLIKVVPYVLWVTLGVPGAPEPRMYPRSGYFLVLFKNRKNLARLHRKRIILNAPPDLLALLFIIKKDAYKLRKIESL